jgi:hypothetical protein
MPRRGKGKPLGCQHRKRRALQEREPKPLKPGMARHGTRKPQQHGQQDQAPNAVAEQDNISGGDGFRDRKPGEGWPGGPDNDGQRGPERAMQFRIRHDFGRGALGMGRHAIGQSRAKDGTAQGFSPSARRPIPDRARSVRGPLAERKDNFVRISKQ